ncbi:MAG TPA: aminoglycoside phosphotransferase family protein [Candidatus Dormibacteraeota bacterium]
MPTSSPSPAPAEVVRWIERVLRAPVRFGRPFGGGIAATVIPVQAGGRRLVLKLPYSGPAEPDPARTEARCLEIAHRAGLPVPELVAVRREALLMTRLPGRHRLRPRGEWRTFVRTLLGLLDPIHAVDVANERLPSYTPYPASDRGTVEPNTWERLLEALSQPEPEGGPRVFIHRDFHQANVLWAGGRVSGIVDWLHGCVGTPWADLAHLRWNLFDLIGMEAADFAVTEFRRRRPELPPYDPYWDVATGMSIGAGRRRDRFLELAADRL